MLWRICCGKNQVADLLFQLVKTEESLKHSRSYSKIKTPITCDLSGLDPNYRQDAINQAEKVLQEEGGRIELAKTTAVLDGNNPGITYASQYAGSGYENAANDLARILNDVATEKAQNDYEQELTEDLQKSADEIHYGNAHAGIHVTIHRINPVSDFLSNLIKQLFPLFCGPQRLQSSILPLLKEEAEGGKQKTCYLVKGWICGLYTERTAVSLPEPGFRMKNKNFPWDFWLMKVVLWAGRSYYPCPENCNRAV